MMKTSEDKLKCTSLNNNSYFQTLKLALATFSPVVSSIVRCCEVDSSEE